jgi:uncharacterized protein (DUF3084 family)
MKRETKKLLDQREEIRIEKENLSMIEKEIESSREELKEKELYFSKKFKDIESRERILEEKEYDIDIKEAETYQAWKKNVLSHKQEKA